MSGFTVEDSKLYYYDTDTKNGAGVGGIPYGGSWAFWAGEQTGNGIEKTDGGKGAYGDNAPFRVGHNGELFATRGEVGGFSMGIERVSAPGALGDDVVNGPVFKSKLTETLKSITLADLCTIETNIVSKKASFTQINIGDNIRLERSTGELAAKDYCVYASTTQKVSYSNAVLKLTFKQNLPYFQFYIASDAETRYDYILASHLNPQLENNTAEDLLTKVDWDISSPQIKEITAAHTSGAQLTLTGNIPIVNIDDPYVFSITYSAIKENDVCYIAFHKDGSVNTDLDTGWVIFPNSIDTPELDTLKRQNALYFTPSGSAALIAGQEAYNWGVSLGTDFGITLDGALHATKANLTGEVVATGGKLGQFKLEGDTIASDLGLTIASDRFSLVKNSNSLSLGVTDTQPYIWFENAGAIWGPSKSCGFKFSGASLENVFNYQVIASSSGSGTDTKLSITLYQLLQGRWQIATKANGATGLLTAKTFYVKIRGYDNPWIGNATSISETVAFTLSPGEYTKTASLSKDYDTISSVFFVASRYSSATSGSNSTTFTQITDTTQATESIGSIIPDLDKLTKITDEEYFAKNVNLGSKAAQWHEVFAQKMHAVKGYFNGDLTASAAASTTSDRKLKNTIEYDISKYDIVFDTLKPVSYKYNDSQSDRTHLGFIAQDVQEAIHNANLTDKEYAIITIEGEGFDATQGIVTDEEKTTYRIRYAELHALEVRQIQLLKQEVKELKAELEVLKSKQT
jgi:hypothetical protein